MRSRRTTSSPFMSGNCQSSRMRSNAWTRSAASRSRLRG
ncbi:Uncharacterised protein [Bordetella pertussis]|nr:Uncharacterised protein [Bordetella pertussis]